MKKSLAGILILSFLALTVVLLLFIVPGRDKGTDIGDTDNSKNSTTISKDRDSAAHIDDSVANESDLYAENERTEADSTNASAGSEDLNDGNDDSGYDKEASADASEAETEEENGNIVIVLDPGHGGKRTGAVYGGVMEKDITLKVADYCRSYLLNYYSGVEVYLTREDDVDLDPDLAMDLEMRAICAEEHKADALVSIHFNACDKHNLKGTTVFISHRDGLKNPSMELAQKIMKEFKAIGLKDNGIGMPNSNDMFDEEGKPLDYYAINRHCAARNIIGIIVEQCFMDNENDQKYIANDAGLAQLGQADAIGIAEYFGLEKK